MIRKVKLLLLCSPPSPLPYGKLTNASGKKQLHYILLENISSADDRMTCMLDKQNQPVQKEVALFLGKSYVISYSISYANLNVSYDISYANLMVLIFGAL